MSLTNFLIFLTGAGGSVAASWILERIPAYHTLESEVKQYVFFFVCLLLSVGAYAIQTYVPPAVLLDLTPWFGIMSGVFSAVFIGTAFHKMDKKA